MTSEASPKPGPPVDASLPGPVQAGVLINRARSLLVGGIIGLHLLVVPAVIIAAFVGGARVAVSVALGAMVSLMFYTIGQAVQIRFAAAPARQLFAASMASFGARAALLALLLTGWANLGVDTQSRMSTVGLCIGVGAGVLGWLIGMARAYAKLRIPVYDEPEPEPVRTSEEAI